MDGTQAPKRGNHPDEENDQVEEEDFFSILEEERQHLDEVENTGKIGRIESWVMASKV